MPAKRGDVISSSEARRILKDVSTMKTALICLQIEAGDRVDSPVLRHPTAADAAKGFRKLPDDEFDEIRDIVRRLIRAAASRQSQAA
jgi:hypothetical protein